MIIDTSALIAILRNEPEAPEIARTIQQAAERRLSAANFVEAAAVLELSEEAVRSRYRRAIERVHKIVSRE